MRARSVSMALFVFAVVALGPLVPRWTAQPASRYSLTAALADKHTVDLGAYDNVLGIDRARYEGHLRSDKGIGQPLLAVPFYVVGRWFGAESAGEMRKAGDLGVWWSTLWMSVVPFALLLVLMYNWARRYAVRTALPAALAIGFATFLLPHAVNLYGHTLAALCAFGAFVVAERSDPSAMRLAAAGALAGFAVAVEYQAAVAAIVVFGAIAWRHRVRAAWMLAGAAPFAALIGFYQWRAFGAWFHTPFAYYDGKLNGTTSGGYTLPGVHNLFLILAGTRGVLYVSPVVIVAIAGAVLLVRRSSGEIKRQAIVALVMSGGFLLLCAGWSGTQFLEEPGARYAIPALPFLVVPLALVWTRWQPVARFATAIGAVLMVAATGTFFLIRVGATAVTYMRYVTHRWFATTTWSMAFGRFGVVLYVATVAAAGWWLVYAATRDGAGANEDDGAEPAPVGNSMHA